MSVNKAAKSVCKETMSVNKAAKSACKEAMSVNKAAKSVSKKALPVCKIALLRDAGSQKRVRQPADVAKTSAPP
jgi:hypothetical protein